eukprot:TRINITY_DN63051_c0_g1_i1.p1 TRINITY_DN63051_c0_g1~~TRINITY_DN63051_c0_g1_i1.p1  ORF type:complete len:788 (+),score=168.57 TRINITY_DN63051_c0_g1_i1:187-2550(+)
MGKCCSKGGRKNFELQEKLHVQVEHPMFIIDNPGDIEEFYHIVPNRLGEGSFARVHKCHNKSTGAIRAVKLLRKKGGMKTKNRIIHNRALHYEVLMMKMLMHPNIVKIYEHFEDNKFVYIVMEYLSGMDLHDAIVQKGHFSDREAAFTFYQVFRAVYYMHTTMIAHRDLKPENIMFSRDDNIETTNVKICDFGHAHMFQKGTWMTTKCGAVWYVSPQMLAGRYDQATDMWTLGVGLYITLCGYPPFSGGNDADTLAKIRLGNYKFAQMDWAIHCPECKDVIRGCLKVNTKDRMKARVAMTSEYISKIIQKRPFHLSMAIIDSFRKFTHFSRFKKAALQIICANLEDEIADPLRDIFVGLDQSGDGLISATEIRSGLLRSGYAKAPPDLEELVLAIDADGSGEIDYGEFMAAAIDPVVYTREDICWSAFRVFDRSGTGAITAEDLVESMNNGDPEQSITPEIAADIIAQYDEDGDKSITLKEFVHMMMGISQPYIYKTEKEIQKDIKAQKRKAGVHRFEKAKAAAESYSKGNYAELMKIVEKRLKRRLKASDASGVERDPEQEALLRDIGRDMAAAQRGNNVRHNVVDFEKDFRGLCLDVKIVQGNVLGAETMDLWVICRIKSKPDQTFSTEAVQDSNEPVWNHEGKLRFFWQEDIIEFIVMDHPSAPSVGMATVNFKMIKKHNPLKKKLQLFVGHRITGSIEVEITSADNQTFAANKVASMFKMMKIRRIFQRKKDKRLKKMATKEYGSKEFGKTETINTTATAVDKDDAEPREDDNDVGKDVQGLE